MKDITKKRLFAALIDYGIFTTYFDWMIKTYGVINNDGTYTLSYLRSTETIFLLLVWFLYFIIPEYIYGQTLGKKILKQKLISDNEKRPTFIQVVKRRMTDFIDIYIYSLKALLNFSYLPKYTRIGDKWAKTSVISIE